METHSQASQDLFYLNALRYKQNGHFLEIGSNHPITHNNTYLAESKYGWKGIMVEYDTSFANLYKQHRPGSIHMLQDACTVDYRSILDFNNFPTTIDYLKMNLDVNNRATLNVLELLNRTVFDKYTFATVTFEHDIYTGNYYDTQAVSRKIFEERGYRLVFPDVSVLWEGSSKPFEDWYIHPSLVTNYTYSGHGLKHAEIIKLIRNG